MKRIKDYRTQRQNANAHTPIGMKHLAESVGKYGIADGITVAADGESLSGSARLETLMELMPDVKIVEVDTDGNTLLVNRRTDIPNANDPKAQALSDAVNIVQRVNYSPDGALLARAAEEDELLRRMIAADDASLKAVMQYAETQSADDAEPQMDRAGELQAKWKTERGQLWRIGEHRLLCGDSTVREDVERVMGGEKADLGIHDPPYGINIVGGLRATDGGAAAPA